MSITRYNINPLVSIITVVYNAENVLDDTIKSIVNQSFCDYEYIVIDGGSNDNTVDIIKNYQNVIDCWVSEPDNGIYDGMNKAVLLAKGEWVIFMNAGDCFVDEMVLEDVFDDKSHFGFDVIYGNARVKNKNITISKIDNLNKYYFYFDTICHQSIFFRTKLFSEIGLYNTSYKILADREWLLRYSKNKKNRFKYVDVDICDWDSVGYTSNNIDMYEKECSVIRCSYTPLNLFVILFIRLVKKFKLFSL